jgi:hypothetical protein
MDNKRHLKKFYNQNEYESQKNEVMTRQHIVLLEGTNSIVFKDGYEYVDLGLTSGTLWATCNVGAESEEDFGLYFAWGNTEGATKEGIENGELTFGTYGNMVKYMDTTTETFTKYNSIDGKRVLDLEDDAAHAHMGGDWHMPTKEQLDELTLDTHQVWANRNGVNGMLFTSKTNSNSIFIPASGQGSFDGMIEVNKNIFIPTKNAFNNGSNCDNFYLFSGDLNYQSVTNTSRIYGFPIRAVK